MNTRNAKFVGGKSLGSAGKPNSSAVTTYIGRKSDGSAGHVYGTVKQEARNIYTFHLDNELIDPAAYRDLFSILRDMGENDEMHLMINAPGGRLDTCAQMVNLIQNTSGTVIGHLLGPSASAHTFILLACHAWVIYPHSSMMAHSYSGGVYEKGNEILKSAQATHKFFEELVTDVYYPFYTEEEIETILDNKDIHIHSKDIEGRLERVLEYRDKLEEELAKKLTINISEPASE